jgi:hypothetical protein
LTFCWFFEDLSLISFGSAGGLARRSRALGERARYSGQGLSEEERGLVALSDGLEALNVKRYPPNVSHVLLAYVKLLA